MPETPASERRALPRVAARGDARVAVLDARHQPVIVMHHVPLADVSGSGLSLIAHQGLPIGARVRVTAEHAASTPLDAEVVACTSRGEAGFRLGCRVTGDVPARLIYDW